MQSNFAHETQSAFQVRQLLLSYLQASTLQWPGGDGLTEDDVLNGYMHACRIGDVPDQNELCRRHVELKLAIRKYFAVRGW